MADADADPNPGEMPTTTPAGETPKGTQAPTIESLQAELEEGRAALKRVNSESAGRRKKLEAFEEAEEARKLADMTELEKLQAELQSERDAHAAAEQGALQAKIAYAVELAAAKANFHNPADAMAFLGDAEFTLDDKGKVEGVAEALAKLVKERPHLVKTPAPNDPDARKRSATTEKVTTSEQAEINRKFGIRDPHVT